MHVSNFTTNKENLSMKIDKINATSMRIFRTLALAVIAALCLAQGAWATDYTIVPSVQYSGSITSTNTSDRYRVVLPMSCKLSVNITSPGGQAALPNQTANVRWLNGSTQIKATTSGFTFPYSDSADVAADIYFIEIVQRSGITGNTGTYNIRTDCFVNSTEPNNTTTAAQLLLSGYTVRGDITSTNNADIYKYVLTEPGRLTVSATLGSSSTGGVYDAYVKWYNADGTQIKSSNPATSYNDYMDLEAGTYYIGITPYGSRTGIYSLRGDFTAAGNNESEPNETRPNAQLLTSGQTVNGFISYQDGTDMYRYVLTQSGRLTVSATLGSSNSTGVYDAYVKWYNADSTQIKSSNPTTSYNNYMDLEAGTYYIGITPYGSRTGIYSLRGDFTAAGNNESEPNETRPDAQLLTSGQTVKGFISYQDDTDMYRYVLTQSGRLTVSATLGSSNSTGVYDAYVKWYNTDGTQIKSSNPTTSYNDYMDLEAGTYYIGITPYGSHTGTYYLTAFTGTAPAISVTNVNIYPSSSISMQKGFTQAFTATVTGTYVHSSQGVTWSVTGNNNSGTTISSSGELTIDAAETAATLTVRATSTVNTSKYNTKTITVTAPIVKVNFDLNGGTGTTPAIISVSDGSKLSTSTKPSTSSFTRTGYINDGEWYTSSTGTTKFVFGESGTSVSGNMTLYLKWIPIFSVTFNANSGAFDLNESFESGTNDWTLVNGSQTNKWVIGTATSNTGSYSAYISNNNSANSYTITSASTVHLYRNITFPTSSSDFTLTFYFKGNGESGYDDMTVRYSTTSYTPTAGSVFSDGTLLGIYQGNSSWTQKTITLPAATFSGKTMRLVFSWKNNASGGTQPPAAIDDINISGIASSQTILTRADSTLVLPSTPTRNGYTFNAWFTATTGGTEVTANRKYSADATVYARWTPITYTITYNLDDGTNHASNPATYTIESSAITLQNPSKTGYTFDGWYNNALFTGTSVTSIPKGSIGNQTYYAKWGYSVSFNLDGGTGTTPANIVAVPNGALTTAQMPATEEFIRAGHINDGKWYTRTGTSPNYTYTEFVFGTNGTAVTNNNTTLYLKWTPAYIVSFDLNGGSGTKPANIIINDVENNTLNMAQMPSTSGFTKNGYVNDGKWYTQSSILIESFENGANGWVLVNGTQTNKWLIGTDTKYDGSYSAYISNNNSANSYTITSTSVVHLYRDITFPTSSSDFTLTFYFKGNGETNYDDMTVRYSTTSTTPTAGSVFSSGTTLGTSYLNNSSWTQKTITLPAATFSGKTMRLVFSWRNDASGGTQPPAAIDDISISSSGNTYTEFVFGNGGTPVTDHTTLYLKWIPTYTVSFNLDGGSGTAPVSIANVAQGSTISAEQMPSTSGFTKSGYANDGKWYIRTGTSPNYTYTEFVFGNGGTAVTANTTIYLKWIPTYTVSFNLDGGSGTAPVSIANVVQGSTISTTQMPSTSGFTKSGYANDGKWYIRTGTSPNYTYTEFVFGNGGTAVTANTTLYLKWISTYTVSFNLNSGSGTAPANIYVLPDSKLSETQMPSTSFTRSGYVNDGKWYIRTGTSPNYTYTEFVFGNEGTAVTASTTLYLKWTPTYTVTFNANSGTVTTSTSTTGLDGTLTSLPTPTRAGYTFDGWFTATTGGTEISNSTVFSANTTIYAQWVLITYTVTFNANGGSITTATGTTSTGGKLASLPVPTRTGYTFDGWFTEETGGTQVTASTVFSANTTIYARWTLATYTITYTLNSGTVETANPANYTINTADFTLNNPTRAGYTFAGWTGANGTTAQTTVSIAQGSTGNKSYTANWTLITYTVTFNANGGTVTTASGTTSTGQKLASLPTPTKAGYTFNGWFTEETGGTQITTSTVFDANSTIYAQWTIAATPPPPPPSIVEVDKCGTSTINYETQFCFDDKVYSLCNGSEYDPETNKCQSGVLQYKCGKSSWYSEEKQFCFDDKVYPLCNGSSYDPETNKCSGNVLQYKCGKSSWYDEEKQFCLDDKVYSLCGGSSYDPETEKCQSGEVIYNTTPILPQSALSNISVQVINNDIMLSNLPQGAKVEVYTLQGKLVFTSGKSLNRGNDHPADVRQRESSGRAWGSDNLRILVQTKGMYIIKVGAQTMRVAVR